MTLLITSICVFAVGVPLVGMLARHQIEDRRRAAAQRQARLKS